MAAYRFTELNPDEKREIPPLCSQDCIWYEPVAQGLACANRRSLICNLHLEEAVAELPVRDRA